MTISPLSRKKINACIRKLGSNKLVTGTKLQPKNIFSLEDNPLKKWNKIWIGTKKWAKIWIGVSQKSEPRHK